MQFYSATQDLCFQVYGRGARQLYPWDLEDPNGASSEKDVECGRKESSDFEFDALSDTATAVSRSGSSRMKFHKSKIFEDEIPIEDEYVKKVQKARYIRTWVVGTVVACVIIAIFLGVPTLPH
jgi:hypothetical protein